MIKATQLSDIPVASYPPSPPLTGNLLPILHEIRHALEHWLSTGETHSIDLQSIPMSPGELDRLIDALGSGEVKADLALMGRSQVLETQYPGAWLVTHFSADDAILGRYIEIGPIPAILTTQHQDARAGLARLQTAMSNAETDHEI